MKERDISFQEMDKLEAKFIAQSEVVSVSMQKVEKALDDKSQDRLKKQWHQEILEMNNDKVNHKINRFYTRTHIYFKWMLQMLSNQTTLQKDFHASFKTCIYYLKKSLYQQEMYFWISIASYLIRYQLMKYSTIKCIKTYLK